MTLFYPDCSNNNWSSTQDAIDFLEQLVPEGFSGMCHKVSEGNYYEDPYWPAVQHWCQHNNLPLIGYHYVTTEDPASQAQTWQGNNGGTLAMLDWEENGGDLANLTAVVDAFNAAGVTVQLGYYPRWYWSQEGGGDLSGLANALVSSAYPGGSGYASTIYANSGGNSGEGWAPYGGANPAAWQFTNSADIAGFTVDCNAYRGSDITVLFGTARAPTRSYGRGFQDSLGRHRGGEEIDDGADVHVAVRCEHEVPYSGGSTGVVHGLLENVANRRRA